MWICFCVILYSEMFQCGSALDNIHPLKPLITSFPLAFPLSHTTIERAGGGQGSVTALAGCHQAEQFGRPHGL